MITVVLFIGITAILAGVCYLGLRPLVLERWEQWQREREEVEGLRLREERARSLRDEAAASVLEHIIRHEDQDRRAA